jgi:hypothetical protein
MASPAAGAQRPYPEDSIEAPIEEPDPKEFPEEDERKAIKVNRNKIGKHFPRIIIFILVHLNGRYVLKFDFKYSIMKIYYNSYLILI